MSSKRQISMAKLARERLVKEKRARKQEKRDARKQEREAGTADVDSAPGRDDDPTSPG